MIIIIWVVLIVQLIVC